MSTPPNDAWRSRIVGHADADPKTLLENPANWRVHPQRQAQALEQLLDEVGWVRHVIVNTTTGHLVDGHLRVRLAIQRGEPTVPVVRVDLSEAEERLVLASLDPVAALAATDSASLMALAASIDVGDSHQPEIARLISELAGTSMQSSSSPTQEQIDQRKDELEHAYEDRHLQSYDATCPECHNPFSFAR